MAEFNKGKKRKITENKNDRQTTPAEQSLNDIIQGEIGDYLKSIQDSFAVGMSNFMLGNGVINNPKQFINNNKKQGKPSILGDKNSIFSLLGLVVGQLSSLNTKIHAESILSKNLNELYQSTDLGEAIVNAFIVANDAIKQNQPNNIKDTNNQLNDELIKMLIGDIESNTNAIGELIGFMGILETKIDNTESQYQNALNIIRELENKSKELLTNEIEKTLNAKLNIVLEGLDDNTIDQLIKFSEINFDKVDQNVQNFKSFFESLNSIQNINVEDVLTTMQQLGKLGPILLVWNKTFNKINYTKFFIKIKGIFDSIKEIKPIDPKLSKDISESIDYLNFILKDLLKLGALGWTVKKYVNFKDISNLLYGGENTHTLDHLFKTIDFISETHINTETNTETNIENIESIVGTINKVLIKMAKMKLGSLAAKIVSYLPDIDELILHLETSLSTIGKNYNKDVIKNAEDKISQIDEAIKAVNAFIISFTKMKMLSVLTRKERFFNSITSIKSLLIGDENKDDISIKSLIDDISKSKFGNQKDSLNTLTTSLQSLSIIIDSLYLISKKKINYKKLQKNLQEFIETIEETYNNIDEKFKNIIKTADLVEQVKAANEKIHEGLDDCTETAVKSGDKEKEIKSANISLEGLTEFMVGATICMSIGALFVMLGGGKFIKAALEFGIVLMAFEALVIAPVLLFNDQKGEILKGVDNLSTFVITCTFIMSIGALFVALGNGKFVQNALVFGILLSVFEILIVSPFLAFNNEQGTALKGLTDFSKFLITTTIIMSIGALFMSLSNGKLVKNSLLFGIALATFELLVITPFILFGLVRNNVLENASKFNAFLITCTTVMLVGALFMSLSNGKLYKNALKFGQVLGAFEALVIAPFLIMNLFKNKVFDGMKIFSTVIISSTIVLMVGALFVSAKGGKYVTDALKFTGLIMAFEIGVIAPFLIFNMIKSNVEKSMIGFAAIVFAVTTTLLIGSLFMTMNGGEMWKSALEFTGVLAAFEIGTVTPLLLFNFVKKEALDSATKFGTFILFCTVSLSVGALFIKYFGKDAVLDYALILGAFVAGTLWATKLISAGMSQEVLEKTIMFGAFILMSSIALGIGAMFMKLYGANYVLGYAIILELFVLGVMATTNVIKKEMDSKAIVAIASLGTFLLLATGSMILGAWFIDKYGWESVATYGVCLTGFVIVMGAVLALLGAVSWAIIPGELAAIGMGVALMALTGSIMIVNALFQLDPGGKKMQKNIKTLNDIIGSGTVFGSKEGSLCDIFSSLGGLIDTPILLMGAAAATAIGGALLILGSSLGLINLLMGDGRGKELKENINILQTILRGEGAYKGLIYIFEELGGPIDTTIIALGAVSILAISASMLVLGGVFELINLLMGKHGLETSQNILTLNNILDQIKWTYTALGALSILIVPGAIAATAIGTSMLILGGALRVIDDIKTDKIYDQINALAITIGEIGAFALLLGALSIPLGIALAGLGMLNLFSYGISNALIVMANSVEQIAKLGDLTNDINLATKNMIKFIKMPLDIFENLKIDEILKITLKLGSLKTVFVIPMCDIMNRSAQTIQDIASLKVPTSWDKDGNPTSYRQLNDNDFDLARVNTAKLLTTMVDTFNTVWNGGKIDNKEIKGLSNLIQNGGDLEDIIDNITDFGIKSGQVMSGVAQSVGMMAKMQIPISWDKNGNPTGFRQLSNQDFQMASKGVELVLTNMIKALSDVYNDGKLFDPEGKENVFDMFASGENWITDIFQTNPLGKVLTFSLKVGNMIGNIGEAVANIAKMQIPEQWDKNGKVTRYHSLSSSDFADMGSGIGTILTSIITTLSDLYKNGTNYGAGDKNIFDMDGNWLTGDKPGPFERVLGFTFKVSEVISKVATGIKDLADLKIPAEINPDGTIKSYKVLNDQDFKNLGLGVGKVLGGVAEAINEEFLNNGDDKYDYDKLTEVMQAIQPFGQFLADTAEGVIKIASGSVPIEFDPKTGKPTKYVSLIDNDITTKVGFTISELMSSIGEGLMWAYTLNQPLFSQDNFAEIIESFVNISDVINNVADIAIKLGQALVADEWDPKTGKPKHYKHIPLDTLSTDIQTVMDQILKASVNAIINVYNGDAKVDGSNQGLKTIIESNQSNFMQAINAISKITQIVSDIVDPIIKLGQAQIPVYKDGKIIDYKELRAADLKAKIETIFASKNGVLMILCNAISTVYTKHFQKDGKENDFVAQATQVNKTIGEIVEQVGAAVDLVVKIASSTIPVGFDKDGKPNKYAQFDKDTPGKVQKIIENVFGTFVNLFENKESSLVKLSNNINISTICDNVKIQIDSIQTLLTTVFDNISTLAEKKDDFDKFAKMNVDDILNKLTRYTTAFVNIANNKLDANAQDANGNTILSLMTNEISDFVQNAIAPYTKYNDDQGQKLDSLINKIYNTISKQKSYGQTFKNNTAELSNFITKVNSVKIDQFNAFTKLLEEFNKFNKSAGSLDKFADVLATKLTVVLSKLVESLDKSAETINNADAAQAKRQKAINDAIKEIKDIMQDPVIIKVSSDTTESEDNGGLPPSDDWKPKDRTTLFTNTNTGEGNHTHSGTPNKDGNPSQGDSRNAKPSGKPAT